MSAELLRRPGVAPEDDTLQPEAHRIMGEIGAVAAIDGNDRLQFQVIRGELLGELHIKRTPYWIAASGGGGEANGLTAVLARFPRRIEGRRGPGQGSRR